MGRKRTNPFQGFTDVISEMARIRELGRTGYLPGQGERQRTHATAWVPTADIFARGRDLVIRIELAGVREEDIDVTLSGGVLMVSGERTGDPDEDEVSFYTHERFYGPFRRSMTLPEGVGEGSISASYEDGLLEITVREAFVAPPAAQPQRIGITKKSGQT